MLFPKWLNFYASVRPLLQSSVIQGCVGMCADRLNVICKKYVIHLANCSATQRAGKMPASAGRFHRPLSYNLAIQYHTAMWGPTGHWPVGNRSSGQSYDILSDRYRYIDIGALRKGAS